MKCLVYFRELGDEAENDEGWSCLEALVNNASAALGKASILLRTSCQLSLLELLGTPLLF